MKNIKKLISLLAVTASIACAGCGSGASQSLTPVEDSGKQVSTAGITASIPKGWTEVENATAQEGFVLSKGLSSITVIKMEQPGLSEVTLDDLQANFETTLAATGAKISTNEQRTYDNVGDGIFFALESTITQEMIDQTVNSGVYNEEATKNTKALIGKTNHEAAVYLVSGDAMIIVDGVTYNDDAAGIEEVITFITNSMTLS